MLCGAIVSNWALSFGTPFGAWNSATILAGGSRPRRGGSRTRGRSKLADSQRAIVMSSTLCPAISAESVTLALRSSSVPDAWAIGRGCGSTVVVVSCAWTGPVANTATSAVPNKNTLVIDFSLPGRSARPQKQPPERQRDKGQKRADPHHQRYKSWIQVVLDGND